MPNVNDVVRNRQTEGGSEGRVCFVGPVNSCVQFGTLCLQVANADLIPAQGNPPPCTPECSHGECLE
jgi:hypothetical protein